VGLLEDACGVAGMQSVEYGRGYICQFAYFPARWREWGFRTMPISVPGHADHRFRDDGDHDSGLMAITRSGLIPIS